MHSKANSKETFPDLSKRRVRYIFTHKYLAIVFVGFFVCLFICFFGQASSFSVTVSLASQ